MNESHPNYDGVLKVGERARDFALVDTDGSVVALSAVLERGPAIVVFYRGDW